MTISKYRQCVRCVMDTSDQEILFDDEGVCSHCHRFDASAGPQIALARNGALDQRLRDALDGVRKQRSASAYDCVLGVSGGADSTFLLMKCVEWGLRPLAVHVDNGWNTPVSENNIRNACASLDVDLLRFPVHGPGMVELQKAFLRAGVKNCELPTDHAFPAVLNRTASRLGIRYVFSGGNLAGESVLPRSWGHNSADYRYLKAVFKRHGSGDLSNYPHLTLGERYIWYPAFRGIRRFRPLDYYPYVPKDAKREISERLGWGEYGAKHHESLYTRFFQGVYLPRKFEIDKRKAHFSSLVLAGLERREPCLASLAEPPYALDQQEQDIVLVAERLEMQERELREILRSAPPEDSYASNAIFFDVIAPSARRLASTVKATRG